MKALILAAGFGTRLRPHTEKVHKALFPIANRPALDWVISSLVRAGCTGIIINTHHLPEQIEKFVQEQEYGIPVMTRYEPQILGTGGAIRNVADFLGNQPFFVINSDILIDTDLSEVYAYHLDRSQWATLVVTDWPGLNSVTLNGEGVVTGFSGYDDSASGSCLTFTGVQVLAPCVIQHIPADRPSSSIETYTKLISRGLSIESYAIPTSDWIDIGIPERYRESAFKRSTPIAFQNAGTVGDGICHTEPLVGDGSDRLWYRLESGGRTLVMADHGIRVPDQTCEVDSFVAIGCHLREKGIPVPRIYYHDKFAGLVFLEDLGDRHLQEEVQEADKGEAIERIYQGVIDILVNISTRGIDGFEAGWAYQTQVYSKTMILERECGYFVEAFLQNHLHLECDIPSLKQEFERIADQALRYGEAGLMHRDFQSRNILLRDGQPYVIDFQGARLGPIQYDLASLLIDPYVQLDLSLQERLAQYCFQCFSERKPVRKETFFPGYRYCSLTRNLQILGAFGYLSTVKGKTQFRRYIPAALRQLRRNLETFDADPFPSLKAIAEQAARAIDLM